MTPDTLVPVIDFDAFEMPPVFKWLAETGNIETREMHRTFNCGIGMLLAVAPENVDAVVASLAKSGETAMIIGTLKTA
jgi:phosphoribosylformylglycinamidine cyclo-ligase